MELSILVNKFNVKGRLVALQPFGNGNINDTFLAIYRNTFTETQVILQRVNRNVFLGGIQGIFPMPDYMLHEPEWYRFNPEVLIYSVSANTWRVAAESELTARAGAALIALPHTAADEAPAALLFGGEKKPGVRTNEVTLIRP